MAHGLAGVCVSVAARQANSVTLPEIRPRARISWDGQSVSARARYMYLYLDQWNQARV